MKTLYLHIGTPKTGTSAIQVFLKDNQTVLASHNYCYDLMPVNYKGTAANVRNGHFLIGEIRDTQGNILENETKAARKECFGTLEKWFEKYDNVILTDEGIWNTLAVKQPDSLLSAKAFCDKRKISLKVIVYLRRQAEYFESLWKQKIRRRGATWTWKSVIKHIPKSIVLDYYEHLCDISDMIGRENIIVRRYERDRFLGTQGTIFSDFLDAIGLEYTDEYTIQTNQVNVSLKNNYAEIKRILNKKLPEEDLEERNREEHFFEEVAMNCSKLEKGQYKSAMFSPKEQKEFMERFRESNQRVAEEFLGEPCMFRDTDATLPKWQRDNPKQYEDLITFLGEALSQQQKEIESLRDELYAYKHRPPLLRRALQKLKK